MQNNEIDNSRSQMQSLLAKFFRSPLAIGIVCGNALLAAGATLAGLAPVLLTVPLFALFTGGELALVLLSKPGAKAILGEQKRERSEHDADRLEETARLRKRLAMLRIENPEAKAAVERLVFAAGLYLESCAKGNARDPIVEDAVRNAAETVDRYLHVSDAGRIGSRIDGEPRTAQQNIEQKLILSLDRSTHLIAEKLALPFGGIEGTHTALDAMDGRQELEE